MLYGLAFGALLDLVCHTLNNSLDTNVQPWHIVVLVVCMVFAYLVFLRRRILLAKP